ncbi:TRAP transporter permease [Thermovenabulum sp.]|uniref:TRAP transporter permease n=1 Tax=Thermovenabulum sp. TaxID=3100335 RepID=UPI003C7B6B1D
MSDKQVINENQIQETIKKYDKTERTRDLKGNLKKLVSIIAIAMALYHLYTSWHGTPTAIIHRSIHVSFMLVLIFFLYPMSSKENVFTKFIDALFIVASIIPYLYLKTNFHEIVNRAGMPTSIDIMVGILLVILVLEAGRRVTGLVLPVLAVIFLLYGLTGNLLSGYFSHKGFSIPEIIEYMYLTTEGIFGTPIGVSAQYLILFVIFGSFLLKSGVGDFITEIALAIAGDKRGGPAQVAVLSSALMGSVNGSAVANVVTTGTFTIPLMKKIGYTPEFAGGVEAAASTGGQILPPVMGAAAFIMAEILGVKYVNIMYAAIIPALLYYFGVFITVYFRAVRMDLRGLDKKDVPSLSKIFKEKFFLLIPLIVLVYLLVKGYTPTFAAFFGILLTVPVSWLTPKNKMNLSKILEALESGAKGSLSVAVTCAVVGIVVGISTLTGLGSKIAGAIISLSGGNLFLTLVFTMIACIILGVGMPSIPAYLLTANMAVPALLKLGVKPFVSHFFVFYYAMLANITPPVALAAYAAAGISGGDMYKTGLEGFKLAIAGFIVPFMYVYNPVLLGIGSNAVSIITSLVTALIGVTFVASSFEGYLLKPLNNIERVLMMIAGLLLMKPGGLTDLIGIVIGAGVLLFQLGKRKAFDR